MPNPGRFGSYINGKVHTNELENFWSLVKRGLKGIYISVESFRLFRYLDEQVYRYRATKKHFVSDSNRFEMAFPQMADKPITYDELVGRRFEQP
ncbi:MAG: transposase [Terriglobales bacterium]